MVDKRHIPTIRLGEIADFRNGINFTQANFGEGIKVINVKDFQDYSVPKFSELSEINPQGVVSTADLLQEGDIIFVRSNGNRELIGRSMYIPAHRDPTTHSAFTIRTRFTSDIVVPRFYAYLFRTPIIRQVLSAYGGGTNISNLNQQILSNLEVPLPTWEMQKAILDILSPYDDLIENNQRRIKLLEQTARDLYQEWFVHFRFPGHEQVEMVESELGQLPNSWYVAPIGQVVDTLGGGTPSTKNTEFWDGGGIVWYVPSDLTATRSMFSDNSGTQITELGLKKSSAKLFPPYSVMMTSRATLGVVSINTTEACTNQGFITCIPNEKLSKYQIYFWILNNAQKIEQLATGATFKEITKSTFRQMPVIVADEQTTSRFDELVEPIGKQLQNLQRRNSLLIETRDLLLPRLISGELDVSNLDIPVSEELAVADNGA